MNVTSIPVDSVRYVKELYPRLKPLDDVIERYRTAVDNLPPIVIAKGGVLVDGFHRWQAHVREKRDEIAVIDLGDLSDLEIRKESIRRNSSHGQQMDTASKRKQAGELYLLGVDEADLLELLSVTEKTLKEFLRDAKREEKQRRRDDLWDRWLNCEFDSYSDAGRTMEIDADTVKNWISEKAKALGISEPPGSRQHFDVWSFPTTDRESGGQQSYFGAVPPQVMENLLWFFTDPGQIVVDLFAGSGTTIEVAKRMGRRVWAADIRGDHYSPHLPIHQHDATSGWPGAAPRKADLVFLDPPYWQQAAGRYSDDPNELAEMDIYAFRKAWSIVVQSALEHTTRVAYVVSPTQLDDGMVLDHATEMLAPFFEAGWCVERRIIVPYSTQQATGQQVTWARENKRMLKLYRDLVVLTP